ncbi:Transposase zinc-ribbon domain-containing protein [Tangfeifania diversioriginum]|uniref:Transposase zinc-ribbon domain-containing protein n=1 Tax=Tangfeifania diversioriginum TaxID=1168035 RepID=A0A1M6L158_9BACT|nr:IS1595 family transposase [Tangfeifania diversioriginum]SHJ64893.1 Transposase zinc-ribbon domain-containing protein [Tangfeifania diversioriginum]
MENKFKSLTIFEFQERFADENACYEYLIELKWGNGFVCPNCGHTNYCKGKRKYDRQFTSCHRIVSPTSGTLFHQLKFSILKAFYIVYYVSTSKKGISSTELSRKLGLRQKTCWSFKQKVMRAMKSSGRHKIKGKAEADETVVGGQEEGTKGRKNNKKKLVVFAIERKGKGISRMYGKVIKQSNSKELGTFLESVLEKDASIKTDKWRGYQPLRKEFCNLLQVESGKKGNNFPDLHRAIMGFKGWLRGMHHQVEHLQAYIDEYCYRFNRSFMKEGIFDNLLSRMVNAPPVTYKQIIA